MRRKTTDTLVIHCSASPWKKDIGAADIDEMHKRKGWAGIGYAQVIRRNGVIEFGRHFDDQGAHVAGHNAHSLGVCLIGGLKRDGKPGRKFEDTFTDAQDDALVDTINFLLAAYPGLRIVGHRDLSPDLDGDGIITSREWLKQCPTFDVAAWLADHGLGD